MGISENADSPYFEVEKIKLMQYPKDDIQKEIMKAAEKVFLENGFPKAPCVKLRKKPKVGLSNIYNYFKNKDDIFCTVVRPVISAFDRMLHAIMAVMEQISWRCIQRIPKMCDRRVHDIDTKSIANCWYCYFSMHRVLHWKTSKRTSPNAPTSLVKEYFRDMKEKHPQMNINVTDFPSTCTRHGCSPCLRN